MRRQFCTCSPPPLLSSWPLACSPMLVSDCCADTYQRNLSILYCGSHMMKQLQTPRNPAAHPQWATRRSCAGGWVRCGDTVEQEKQLTLSNKNIAHTDRTQDDRSGQDKGAGCGAHGQDIRRGHRTHKHIAPARTPTCTHSTPRHTEHTHALPTTSVDELG